MPERDIPMMSNRDRLIYMANQIARNLMNGQGDAADAIADHIASYWNPRMKEQIVQVLRDDPEALSDAARTAVARLRDGGMLHQSPMPLPGSTEEGRSDA